METDKYAGCVKSNFKVYYVRPGEKRQDMVMGYRWCKGRNLLPTWENLEDSHAFILDVDAYDPEQVWVAMQGENWSPNGEARPLIEELGLWHTSMSVGDILVERDGPWDVMYMVDGIGFKQVGEPRRAKTNG